MVKKFAGTPIQIVRDWRESLRKPEVGVKVNCGTCTMCCRSQMPVGLTDEEAAKLPHTIRGDGRKELAHKGDNCVMFDVEKNRCSIYDSRPLACRSFDCRAVWLAGMRVHHSQSFGFNEVLDQWETKIEGDEDIGVMVLVWNRAREIVEETGDAMLAGPVAIIQTGFLPDGQLKKIGADVRKKQPQAVSGALNVLNTHNSVDNPQEE